MKSKKYFFIHISTALLTVISFFLPWMSKGFISVIGINIPKLNKILSSAKNILYTFTPEKKSLPEIGYILYIIPIVAVFSCVALFLKKYALSRYLMLVNAIVGIIASSYIFYILSGMLGVSSVGTGIYVLFAVSIGYIVLFFTTSTQKKNKL